MEAVQIKDPAFIEALNRWRYVFTKLEDRVRQATDSTELVKKHILDYVSRAIADGAIEASQVNDMLRSLLKITSNKSVIG